MDTSELVTKMPVMIPEDPQPSVTCLTNEPEGVCYIMVIIIGVFVNVSASDFLSLGTCDEDAGDDSRRPAAVRYLFV